MDDVAARLRQSQNPRLDLVDAIDDLLQEWDRAGYPLACISMTDHLKTLGLAADEAERTNGGRIQWGPVLPPRHGA